MIAIEQLIQDKVCVEWSNSLKPSTVATYRFRLLKYCEYTDKSPSTLINEAREDYLDSLDLARCFIFRARYKRVQ